MTKFIALAAILVGSTVHAATPAVERAYERCLVQLIKDRGLQYASDYAGSTVCDRKVKRWSIK